MAKSQSKKKAQVKKPQEVLGVSKKRKGRKVKNKTQKPAVQPVMHMGPTGKKRMQK